MEKIYKCVCGKEFKSSQAINGHKANCIKYLKNQFADAQAVLDDRQRRAATAGKNAPNIRKARSKAHKTQIDLIEQSQMTQWISEQHKCERCGKVMTEKFGSGRFCSRACANSKVHSEETKQKISKALKRSESHLKAAQQSNAKRKSVCKELYYSNPNYCKVCEKIIPYEKRYRKTCSDTCLKISNKANGGLKEGSVKNYKAGYYKGIRCDSSWELAFLVYNLDHGIPIKRNTESFSYKLHNQEHKYYPDFIIDDTYIEIKNYINEMVQAKIDYFPYKDKYQLLLYNDLKLYIDYCEKTYGKDYWCSLYD